MPHLSYRLLGYIFIGGVTLLIIYATILHAFLGYPRSSDPEEVARWIVEGHRDPKLCYKMNPGFLPVLRPQTGTLKRLCVLKAATYSLESSVCELLLPDEYGMSCLSDVGGKIFAGQPCSDTLGRNEVLCLKNQSGDAIKIDNPQLQNCMRYKRIDLQDWCYQTRTYQYKNVYECNHIQNAVVKDQCENGYAFKQKNPSLCSAVKDLKRREYCDIRINTWLKYPELRSSFYFGIKVPID